jgi:site-specific recombinase XerD
MERVVGIQQVKAFGDYLRTDEKSGATVEKYLRDLRVFVAFANGRTVNKDLAVAYKGYLTQTRAVTSANSMIAALNAFFHFAGWQDCCIRQYKVQKAAYCPEEKELTKEEYIRLVHTANQKGDRRTTLILQTICGTGIRVSELPYITVEAVQRGEAVVRCKGKTRTVFIVDQLRMLLMSYAQKQGITAGAVFVTKNGRPLDRSNIWRGMKDLCAEAHVSPDKVFPHNLRHLFAHTFYDIEKDIVKLADILGHSSINTTRIYTVQTGAEHKRKMENMHLIVTETADVPDPPAPGADACGSLPPA